MRDILEVEKDEQNKDTRFLIVLGSILFLIALFICCILAILPAIEQINPVGNLIIIR